MNNIQDLNPLKKDIILYGPKYTNTAAKNAIENLSTPEIRVKVINNFEEFLLLLN